jgi:hypothetical protein
MDNELDSITIRVCEKGDLPLTEEEAEELSIRFWDIDWHSIVRQYLNAWTGIDKLDDRIEVKVE